VACRPRRKARSVALDIIWGSVTFAGEKFSGSDDALYLGVTFPIGTGEDRGGGQEWNLAPKTPYRFDPSDEHRFRIPDNRAPADEELDVPTVGNLAQDIHLSRKSAPLVYLRKGAGLSVETDNAMRIQYAAVHLEQQFPVAVHLEYYLEAAPSVVLSIERGLQVWLMILY
jgi:hypothetical protein